MVKIAHSRLMMLAALAVLSGCAKTGADATVADPTSDTANASAAILAPGDLVPARTFKLATPPDLEAVRLTDSSPGSPNVVLQLHPRPETRTFKSTLINVEAGSNRSTIDVPIDNAKDAQIFVAAHSTDRQTIASVERDFHLSAPTGKMLVEPRMRALSVGQRPTKESFGTEETRVNGYKLEAGAGSGVYSLKVGDTAAATGYTVEVRIPSSTIELALTPAEHQFEAGSPGVVRVNLADAGAGIAGASLDAWLVGPDGSKLGAVAFKDSGGGVYETDLARVLSEQSGTGIYNVFVHATGTANGVKFDRLGSTAIGFCVPTAKLVSATTPKAVEQSGTIVAFETSVQIDVASADRYEISAALAAAAPDGSERIVVSAQTAELLQPGLQTVTLRFDAAMAGLSKMDGPYTVRGLDLFSQGRQVMIEHLARGLDLRGAPVAAASLPALTQMTPAIEERIQNGDFVHAE